MSDFEGEKWAVEEVLLRVAWYYYKDEMTQDEIARRMMVSRASVGRMLDRARKVGLVSISLNARHLTAFELSARLCETFGLEEALVVPDFAGQPLSQRAVNGRIGVGGAQYLNTHLRPGGTLGVGWGDTVARVMAAADVAAAAPLHIVTLTGGVDGYLQALAHSRWESTVGGPDLLTASVIPSPIVVTTPTLAASLRAEPTINEVLQRARTVQHAIVGVGTTAEDATLVRMGYLTSDDARLLGDKGAVGDILGQFFTSEGKVLDMPLHERRIGVELCDLAGIGKVVGVAGGMTKIAAIRGALAGKYLDVLVTNEQVAQALLG
jgi:lsr operon transcriptional repressor